jgi:hypothetical protein
MKALGELLIDTREDGSEPCFWVGGGKLCVFD